MLRAASRNALRPILAASAAIGVSGAAFLLREVLQRYFHFDLPTYITFFPAVMLVALFFGLWPGVVATAASSLLAIIWILPPVGSFKLGSASDAVALSIFTTACIAISIVAEALHRSQRRLALLQQEQAQRETDFRLHAAMASTSDAVFLSDVDGNFVDFNEAFATFHKFQSKTECAKTLAEYPAFLDVLWPDGQPVPLEMWAVPRALRGEAASEVEYGLRRKDTGESWAGSYSFSPIRDEQGAIIGSVVIARDITQQKRAVAALRASEDRYRKAFNISRDGNAIIRLADRMYIDVNPQYVRTTGWEREELLGHTSTDINLYVDPGYPGKLLEMVVRDGSYREIHQKLRRKNGEIFWGVLSASLVEIDSTQCIYFVLRDITEQRRAEQEQRSSEARYRAAFQTSFDAITLMDLAERRFIETNDQFLKVLGFAREEVVGHSPIDLKLWAVDEDRRSMIAQLQNNGRFVDHSTQLRRKSGEIFWATLSAAIIEINGKECILSTMRDVTEARKAEESMRVSESRYRTIFQTSQDAIAITRLNDSHYIDANQALLDLTGYTRDEFTGHTALALGVWANPKDRETVYLPLLEGKNCHDVQVQFNRKNGEPFWARVSASLIEIDGEQCVLSVVRDITESRQAQAEIHNLAFFDPLTGLANRRLLMEQLRKSVALSQRTHHKRALMIVDLDNFKNLNDALGIEAGDLVLREAARRLSACVREADTVGRIGGDEFALLLEELDENAADAAGQAMIVAEKVLGEIDHPFQLGGRDSVVTCSIGITIFGGEHEDINELPQKAEIALYQAKAAGRNTMRFFAPALQAAVNERASMEDDLRHSIKERQFVLHYQPQVAHGRLIGAEALVRWNHPRLGLLQPDSFISLAEETRLILPLGNWVLDEACRQIAAWADRPETSGICVAVNISALQLRRHDFVDTVIASLARAGASPHNLKLEITESMLLDDIEEVITKMTALKRHGVGFSVDDFGTGYSSLAYLKRLPLDQLKIDRSFVRDILVDSSSRAIAQAIVSLSQAMGLPVIAEGVETEEQRQILALLGCDAYQGYLFGRPIPVAEFEQTLTQFTGGAPAGPL